MRLIRVLVCSGLLLAPWLALAGCDGCEREGPAERAGEKVDDAVEDAGDAAEDAGDKVEDALD